MGLKFTQVPTDAYQELQLNAGILLSTFTPSTPTVTVSNIIGATSGGVKFSDVPSYKDFGEDVDNCPKNTKELKRIESREVKMSGTFVTLDTTMAKRLMGGADIDTTDTTKVTARDNLESADFETIWWVGDYSDKNGATNGGFIAIKLNNALNTAGFSLQSGDKDKGKFAFDFTAHYSISAIDTVPYEIYVKSGTAEPTTNATASSGK